MDFLQARAEQLVRLAMNQDIRAEHESALALYERARTKDETIIYRLAVKQYEEGNLEQALTLFCVEFELEPTNTDALCYAAGISYLQGNDLTADSFFKGALDIEPHNPDLWNQYGNFLSNTNKQEQAIEAYNRALDEDPSSSTTYYNLGKAHLLLGNYEQARYLFGQSRLKDQEQNIETLLEFCEMG